MLCVDLLGASSEGRQRVRIQNGIESPVTLRRAAIYLLTDPEQATWALAPLSAASGERFHQRLRRENRSRSRCS